MAAEAMPRKVREHRRCKLARVQVGPGASLDVGRALHRRAQALGAGGARLLVGGSAHGAATKGRGRAGAGRGEPAGQEAKGQLTTVAAGGASCKRN